MALRYRKAPDAVIRVERPPPPPEAVAQTHSIKRAWKKISVVLTIVAIAGIFVNAGYSFSNLSDNTLTFEYKNDRSYPVTLSVNWDGEERSVDIQPGKVGKITDTYQTESGKSRIVIVNWSVDGDGMSGPLKKTKMLFVMKGSNTYRLSDDDPNDGLRPVAPI